MAERRNVGQKPLVGPQNINFASATSANQNCHHNWVCDDCLHVNNSAGTAPDRCEQAPPSLRRNEEVISQILQIPQILQTPLVARPLTLSEINQNPTFYGLPSNARFILPQPRSETARNNPVERAIRPLKHYHHHYHSHHHINLPASSGNPAGNMFPPENMRPYPYSVPYPPRQSGEPRRRRRVQNPGHRVNQNPGLNTTNLTNNTGRQLP